MPLIKIQNPRLVVPVQGVFMFVWIFVMDLLLFDHGLLGSLLQALITALLFILVVLLFSRNKSSGA